MPIREQFTTKTLQIILKKCGNLNIEGGLYEPCSAETGGCCGDDTEVSPGDECWGCGEVEVGEKDRFGE